MDAIFEIIFEVILEGIFHLTIHNPKVKTWAKTAVFVVLTQALAGFFGYVAMTIPVEDGDNSGNIICGVIAAAMSIGFAVMAVYGHKRRWKETGI